MRTIRPVLSTAVAMMLSVSSVVVVAATAVVGTAATTEVVNPSPAEALDDGLARTPPMGFNNWNFTACRDEFNQDLIVEITDTFVETGLRDAGYEFINIDDCWARPQNSEEGSRGPDGRLVPDPERFPNGIDWLADYVHSRDMKFGIYTSAGTRTCNSLGFDGGLGFEEIDAQTFADWGVDYLKYDNCNNQGVPAIERYTAMRDALQATERPIVYSITEWGQNDPWEWGADVGHLWRTTGDISDNWNSMLSIMKQNAFLDPYAGPGHWNDPDMLQIGNGGMTNTEYRSHFSLWSIMAAPLLIGTDVRNASQETLDILMNEDVIAVNQDALGIQGKVLSNEDGLWVFSKPLENGDVAVALFNENSHGATISTTAKEVGLPKRGAYVLDDLWQDRKTETASEIAAHVPAHGTVMYRVSVDPDFDDYPATVSFEGRVDSPAQSSDGQFILPGRPFEVDGNVTNHGRTPVNEVELQFAGPTAHEGVTHEGEGGRNTFSGQTRASNCGGCSGGQKAGFIGNSPDNWVQLNDVTVPATGTFQMDLYGAVDGTRSFFVSINGGEAFEVPATGTSFGQPIKLRLPIELQAGTNTIRFFNDTAWAPDLDRVVVTGDASLDDWTVSPTDPLTAPALPTGQQLTATWTVTPPADAAPGSYDFTLSSTYAEEEGGEQHPFSTPIRVLVPHTPPLTTGHLSDQLPLEAINGWGPIELDTSNGEQSAGDGNPITIGGVQYDKGIGAHAPGDIQYFAAGQCTGFHADVGVDDEEGDDGSVTFEVWADGTKVADSGLLTYADPAKALDADISGAAFIRLVVTDGGDNINSDHADWADAQVSCGG